MKKTTISFLAGIFLFACCVTPGLADSSLPDAVPDDFPFPGDASLRVQDSTSATMVRVVVAFSLKSDPGETYSAFRRYVLDNGYDISMENKEDYNFSSTHYGSGESIGVRISQTGSVNIVTVTFAGPNNQAG